jgi:hypothetical protein
MSDITVNDRRLFNKEGELNDTGDTGKKGELNDTGDTGKAGTDDPAAKPGPKATDAGDQPNFDHMPPSFSSLVIAIATSVMIQLGEASPDGTAPPKKPDFPTAKHNIDLLAVLEAKTKGNLDEGEEQLLKTLLYDLRMKYVSMIKK